MKIDPFSILKKLFGQGDTRVYSTDGHPILPIWMKEIPRENLMPFNQVHVHLKVGRELDGHRVNKRDFDWSQEDD